MCGVLTASKGREGVGSICARPAFRISISTAVEFVVSNAVSIADVS